MLLTMRFARTGLLLLVAGCLLSQTASAQKVVDNSVSHLLGASSPNNGPVLSYSPSLTLSPGTYRYRYTTGGGTFLSNFYLLVNFNAWTPLGSVTLFGSPVPILFSFNIPPGIPLCSWEAVRIVFERRVGLFWSPVGTFELTVVIDQNGEPGNLTYVSGVSKAYYAGDDYKAHSMTWTGLAWSYAAINPLSNWGTVQIEGRMASFADGTRIVFKGKDGKLYNLAQSGLNWVLSQVAPALPNVAGNVVARNSNEVVFFGSDNQIHQLTFSGSWTDQIILPVGGWGAGGAPERNSINLPTGSARIFFVNGVGALCNVNLVNGSWILEQMSPASVPPSYQFSSDLLVVDDYAAYYKGRDNFIHRYVKCGPNWSLDAMQLASASDTNVVVGGHLTKFPGEDRVFYKAAEGRIYNVYAQYGVWFNYPLGGTDVGVAGDLVAAEGKIFYIHHDKRVHNAHWTGSWSDGPLSTASQANTKACINVYY